MFAMSNRNLIHKFFIFVSVFTFLCNILSVSVESSLISFPAKSDLFDACIKGHLDIINEHIQNGLDLNIRYRCIHLAVYYAHLVAVKLLFENVSNYNFKDIFGSSPLMRATKRGHFEIVQFLIELGADLDTQDNIGSTPLIESSRYGYLEIVSFLLCNGADVFAINICGHSALKLAKLGNHTEITQILEDHISYQNSLKNILSVPVESSLISFPAKSDLFDACIEGHLDIINEHIQRGLDLNIRDIRGSYPINLAARYGHLNAVKLLVENGAKLNVKDGSGCDSLYIASFYGRLEVVDFLIGLGLDINFCCGSSPLKLAALCGHFELVQFLIELGADVDVKDNIGLTPLMASSRNGYIDIVNFLLSHGADVFAIDFFGNMALREAIFRNHTEIVRILKDNILYRNSLKLGSEMNAAKIIAPNVVLMDSDNAPEVVFMDTDNATEDVSEITEDESYDFATVSDSSEADIQVNAEHELETEFEGWLL